MQIRRHKRITYGCIKFYRKTVDDNVLVYCSIVADLFYCITDSAQQPHAPKPLAALVENIHSETKQNNRVQSKAASRNEFLCVLVDLSAMRRISRLQILLTTTIRLYMYLFWLYFNKRPRLAVHLLSRTRAVRQPLTHTDTDTQWFALFCLFTYFTILIASRR